MRLIGGDCIEAMRELPDQSVDAIVTDPPYGLGFMGKAWDDLPPGEEWGRKCLRVLKPGGHLLAFGGGRTYHRLACAVEDAGFEVRDQMMWLYGSGFPKSLDVSKAIDKHHDCEHLRQFKSKNPADRPYTHATGETSTGWQSPVRPDKTHAYSAAAQRWEGWGTALKPAHEPIVVARKPLAGTVAENVLRFGTGALNIDGCRIGTDDTRGKASLTALGQTSGWNAHANREVVAGSECGRWPANVVMDEEAGRLLDEQSGELHSQATNNSPVSTSRGVTAFGHAEQKPRVFYGLESGGASRFFYCAKASKGERNAGLDGFPLIKGGSMNGEETRPDRPTNHPFRQNHHPTVKPISLMRYLVRLVTPPEGTVLDPFLGSGTTGCAAVLEGFDFIGIEREPEYLAIAEARIAWWYKHRGEGETDDILKAAGVRDEIEAGGQLGLLEDAA